MSLRARLAWTYGAAVFVAVVLLAIASIAAIDRSLRSSLDARLETAALAATGLVDVHHERLSLDPEDRSQLLGALASEMAAAVFTADGRIYAASGVTVPASVRDIGAWTKPSVALYSAGSGERRLRVAVAPVARDGTVYGAVAVWQGDDYIDEFDRNAVVAMALAALGIGGVVVLLSQTLARRALAPLERFTELATEIEAHDLSQRVGKRGSDELGRLGSAFDRMLDRLEGAFGRQRRFTADASHELRAPLAVIRAEADAALGKDRSGEEYREALRSIVHEVDRIDGLVDTLLLAARADSARLKFEPVDLAEVALLTVARFDQAAHVRGVALQTELADASIDGDAQALERALGAIVHNALDFAKTRIVVRVADTRDAVHVTVEDDGPGFTSEGLTHALERFWRADPARARGGSGLGLSIVDAIVQAHRGRVVLENLPHGGASVTLVFPFIGASSPHATMEA